MSDNITLYLIEHEMPEAAADYYNKATPPKVSPYQEQLNEVMARWEDDKKRVGAI